MTLLDREPVSAASPLEWDEDDGGDNIFLSQFMHQAVFVDHSQGYGVMINPLSVLRMRIQRD